MTGLRRTRGGRPPLRPQQRDSRTLLLAGLGLLGLACAVVLAIVLLGGDSEDTPPEPVPPPSVTGQVIKRDVVVSFGGYNAFAGAWNGPNGSIWTAFPNVTGPAAAPCKAPGDPAGCDNRGFAGADHRFVIVESTDRGRSWHRSRADEKLPSANPHAYTGQPVVPLAGREGTLAGTLLRRVNGEDLSNEPGFKGPKTAFLQRLEPGADRWTGQQTLLDPAKYTYNLSRIQRLRDGKTLVATGSYWDIPAGQRQPGRTDEPAKWLLMTSTDEGKTWKNALETPADIETVAPANEWDVAETRDGDLLAVMRVRPPGGGPQVRKQALLKKQGDRFEMSEPADPPAALQLDNPQHPELLYLRYGQAAGGILNIADQGVQYTADGGKTWQEVRFRPPNAGWTPHYYPNSTQAPDGRIYVFSHAGADENYRSGVNKPVYVDDFRLIAANRP